MIYSALISENHKLLKKTRLELPMFDNCNNCIHVWNIFDLTHHKLTMLTRCMSTCNKLIS